METKIYEFGDKIHVAIKSYKRAGKVKTAEVVPFAYIYVPESQGDEYREYYGDRIIVIPDEMDGNLGRKQNAILDMSPREWTLILDDDISAIGYWDEGRHYYCDPWEIEYLIAQGFVLANDLGVELWGINQGRDELWYHTYKPFNLLAPVLGPFHGHLNPSLRYDESALGKDDYDFWLLNIHKFHKTLRINKFHYLHNHGEFAGGFVSMRSEAVEQRGVERMREKWGDRVFKPGGSSGGRMATGKNILNSLVRIPINGC